jgi:hypothetical protein
MTALYVSYSLSPCDILLSYTDMRKLLNIEIGMQKSDT